MKIQNVVWVVALLIIWSCKDNQKETEIKSHSDKEKNDQTSKSAKHWSYMGETGPEHWAELEKQSDCNGERQSPIDITDFEAVKDANLNELSFHYSKSVKLHDIMNNGHSIQYNFEMGDFMIANEKKYELAQFHFHEASEHTINGVRYPLEMHLVHIGEENKIAVIAIMATQGENSDAFDFLEKYLPIEMGDTKPINTYFDMNMNLPKDKSYYAYEGSLTTPPCTQNVSWYVLKNPITISKKQVTQLKALMPMNNYRTEQALNGRNVKVFTDL